MKDNEKRDFAEVIKKTAAMYDKEISMERIGAYWNVLNKSALQEIMDAINKHAKDTDRGRFFPMPADIIAKLPNSKSAWPDANEAWAMCPKDEISSAAMCDEMASAYAIAQELVYAGDMVAARMAFIAAYNREVETAASEGKKPRWFASYGDDKEMRYIADRDVVRMKNIALPIDERMKLPDMKHDQPISLEQLSEKAGEKLTDPKQAKENLSKIIEMLK